MSCLKNVEIAFYQSKDRPVARYVSATTVREEVLEHGRWVGAYWSATGQVHRDNVVDGLPGQDSLALPLHAFDLEIDGQSLHNRWEWVGATQRPGMRPNTVQAVVELRHQVRPVTVRIVTQVDGSPILTRWLEVTNTGSAPAVLSHVSSCSGLLWDTDPNWDPSRPDHHKQKFTLGYFESDLFGQEGHFVWTPLPPENLRIERTRGKSHGPPYYILKNEVTGEMFFLALGWSGNCFADFNFHLNRFLFFRMGPLCPAPLRVIAPGETVLSPKTHLGPMHTDLDSAVADWQRHMRTSVIPPRPAGKEMFTVAGRIVEEPGEWILREVDIAAEMGVEAFMVDAAWYGENFAGWMDNRGDWFEGDWLPGGMAGIRKHVHDKGLLFGVWMEAEAIAEKSRLFREHPDWTMWADDNRTCGATLNLGRADAAKYVEDSVRQVIQDFKIDYYKLDYNCWVREGSQNPREGFAENEAWRHNEVIYALYERMRKEFPNVVFENCASGGGRNDIGMISNFHFTCESDYSTFPASIRAINTLSFFIPPEAICYYHNHIPSAHLNADLDTHLRVTLFGTPIFVGFGGQSADRTTDYFQKTKRYIQLHKTFCRPVLAGQPRVFHHTPDIGMLTPADWCVLEYAAPDRRRGYAGIFKLHGMTASEYLFHPRGIDPGLVYTIILDNQNLRYTMRGQELMNTGIRIRLDASCTSELVMYNEGKE